MTEIDINEDAANTGYHLNYVNSDGGLAYSISDNIIVDCGINAGVTRAAQDWQPLVGISFRF